MLNVSLNSTNDGIKDDDVCWRAVAGAVVGGLVGALPIGRLHGWGRAAYVSAPGILAATGALMMQQQPARDRVLLAVVGGGVGLVGQNLGILTDRAVVGWLSRRGVRRPRLVIIGLSALYGGVVMARNDPRAEGRAGTVREGNYVIFQMLVNLHEVRFLLLQSSCRRKVCLKSG